MYHPPSPPLSVWPTRIVAAFDQPRSRRNCPVISSPKMMLRFAGGGISRSDANGMGPDSAGGHRVMGKRSGRPSTVAGAATAAATAASALAGTAAATGPSRLAIISGTSLATGRRRRPVARPARRSRRPPSDDGSAGHVSHGWWWWRRSTALLYRIQQAAHRSGKARRRSQI